ncbi:MAG TPA: hypothetical protein PKN48_02565 [Bacteroidales bacterium]|nr:hypothetical protein [Bacteroidales bacterium]
MNWFRHTNALINDIDDLIRSGVIQEDSAIINYHLIKIGILSFSSEVENDLKELVSRRLNGYKNFCQLCNKLRNPKISEINDALKELGITKIEMDDGKKSKFSSIILNRDKIAHIPDFNANITFSDLKEGVMIGTELLKHIDSNT